MEHDQFTSLPYRSLINSYVEFPKVGSLVFWPNGAHDPSGYWSWCWLAMWVGDAWGVYGKICRTGCFLIDKWKVSRKTPKDTDSVIICDLCSHGIWNGNLDWLRFALGIETTDCLGRDQIQKPWGRTRNLRFWIGIFENPAFRFGAPFFNRSSINRKGCWNSKVGNPEATP